MTGCRSSVYQIKKSKSSPKGELSENSKIEILSKILRSSGSSPIKKRTAVALLSRRNGNDAFLVIYESLKDENQQVRTSAYYALPTEFRPKRFDYTMDPTLEGNRYLDEQKKELFKRF